MILKETGKDKIFSGIKINSKEIKKGNIFVALKGEKEDGHSYINEAIKNGGTTFRDYRTPDGLTGKNQHNLDCYGRAGEACKSCSSILKNRVIGQRSTTWCPQCQIS